MTRINSVSRSAFGFRNNAASTGISVNASINEPAIAKLILKAIGLNILPSSPCKLKSGKNTTIIMRIANAIGLATSFAAVKTASVRLTLPPCSSRSAMIRKEFSTITTAPSTIIPMPIARPASDIKLAESPA